jgi:hypothetical protein
MIRIIYAASNNYSSKLQLIRFLEAVKNKPYKLKIAAFKKSSPNNYNIDWTLDCLNKILEPDKYSDDFTNDDNYKIYYNQVKKFNPDLIISDLEYFTSHIANDLNIKLWQCNSSFIRLALPKSQRCYLGTNSYYRIFFNKNPMYNVKIQNMINNSNRNFIYSHFGDLKVPPILNSKFEWIRPYHLVGRSFATCKHNLISGSLNSNKGIYTLLSKYPDSVSFTEFYKEKYNNLTLKDINNREEYTCNVYNSNLFVCEGQTSFLADAYYNSKYSIIMLNALDAECITNSAFSCSLSLSKTIYSPDENISFIMNNSVTPRYNPKVKFLHQKIDELIINYNY